MKNIVLLTFLLGLGIGSIGQNSYELYLSTPCEDEIEYVYHDNLNDEEIIIHSINFNEDNPDCVYQCIIYSINSSGDTLRWPFVDKRNDTSLVINTIIRETTGEYILVGTGWTIDSTGPLKNAFDYFTGWDANFQPIWETIHERPQSLDSISSSICFKTLKLSNGNYLFGRTIETLEPLNTTRYYLTEINPNSGLVVDERLSHRPSGYLQGLTYTFDSANIRVHVSRTWMSECNRHSPGFFLIDTATYDTLTSYCYHRDNHPPNRYWCVHLPYGARLQNDGHTIVAGTGNCLNLSGPSEHLLFIYEYDTGYDLVNKTYLTDGDTLFNAGWYECLDINTDNEICLAGNHDRYPGSFTSHYSQIYLVKVNEDLEVVSERYLGGDAQYIVMGMDATSDGGIVVSGTRFDYLVNNFEHDGFVIKVNDDLWVGYDEACSIPVHSVRVYPNPGDQHFKIRTTEYPSRFEMVDAAGRVLISLEILDHISSVNASNLNPGLYTWILKKNGQVIDNGKWIKSTK